MKPSKSKPGIKAVGLLSGGLDSTLAAKLMLEQGIEVYGINFTSPFYTCTPQNSACSAVASAAQQLGNIPLKIVFFGDAYLQIVQTPKHGYGSGINPCIDCRIIKIKQAGEYMRKIGASFLFTGEVLGQRPMSQHRKSIELIDRRSGLAGYILRPLSGALFAPTVPEQKGWVERKKLLEIQGRSRKLQIKLAAEKGITDYPSPAGGCLLTDKNFSERMRDYFQHTSNPLMRDIPLLKIGRHFRIANGDKVIVARDEKEGIALQRLAKDEHQLFYPQNFSGPVVLLKGTDRKTAMQKLLEYTVKKLPAKAVIENAFKGKISLYYPNNGSF